MSSTHSPGWEPPSSDAALPQQPSGQPGGEPRYGDYGAAPAGQPSYPQAGPQGYSGHGAYQAYSNGGSPAGPAPYGGAPTAAPDYYGGAAPYVGGVPNYYGGAAALGAPRPGIIPLRPLAFGEILAGAFESLRANPRAMFVPALVVMAFVGALTALASVLLGTQSEIYALANAPATLTDDQVNAMLSELLLGYGGLILITAVLSGLATTVLTGLLIVTVSRTILGRVASPGEVWRRTKGRVWALIGQALLSSLITGGVLLVIGAIVTIPMVLLVANDGTGPGGAAAAVIASLIAIVAGMLVSAALYFKLCLAPAALILEHVGVVEGLRRSWALTRGHFWRVAGINIVAGLIVAAVTQILNSPVSFASGLLAQSPSSLFYLLPLPYFLSSLVSAITLPFIAAVTALLYTDLRMRSEGLDIELRRAAGV